MAVYTELESGALEAFLASYDIGGLVSYQGIAEGVENSNFLLKTTEGTFILTLFERRVNARELPWFLGLMRHLADRGLVCPQPVVDREGTALRTLADRPCAITTFLSGASVSQPDISQCFEVGAVLAALHRDGAGFDAVRRNGLSPAAWGPLLASCGAAGDALLAGLTAELETALADVLAAWPDALPVGQIHADMFPDNVFFQEGRVSGLIDFYFACTDFFAYDLAICLNAWAFPDERTCDTARYAALIAGYESVRPLTDPERMALPVLCQGAAIRFLLTRLYDWVNTPADALVVRKDPLAYLWRLRYFRARSGVAVSGVAAPGVAAR